MEYILGVGIAVAVGLFTTVTGFDRDRSLYPVILVVIASYYELFAVMGGGKALGAESFAFALFVVTAVIGFRTSLWIVAAALIGHGVFDWVHGSVIENDGVPSWWPMWCMSYDVVAGAYLAWRLLTRMISATHPSTAMD